MKMFAALVLACSATAAFAQAALDPGALRDEALRGDTLAYQLVEDLTTEVGPRLAGTEAEARARA